MIGAMYLPYLIEEPLESASLDLVSQNIFLILGDAGSGKEIQGYLLSKHFSLPFLSLGKILRETTQNVSHMSQTIHAALSTGEFVSNEIAAPLLEALTLRADCRDGYILVGYPRNLAEAHFLDALAAKQQKRIQAIFIFVPYDVAMARLVRNKTCKGCGKALDAFIDSPNANGICLLYCSVCGNSFNDTADTSLEEVERLYRSNERDIESVRSHYQGKQSLLAVEGVGSIEEVFRRMVKTVVGTLRMPPPGGGAM